MSINTSPTAPVTLTGEPLEFVEDFTYLCSLTCNDSGAQKYIKARWESRFCFRQTSEHLEVQAVYHEDKDKTSQQ